MIYKMSRKLQDETLRHRVQNKKDIGNRKQGTEQWQNRKRT